jgi:hypothetical protein
LRYCPSKECGSNLGGLKRDQDRRT